MPTYEYMCQACGHQWEAFQRMKDDPLRDCPVCAQPQAKRQISAGTGFILKGGGWYADLYSSSSPGAKQTNGNGSKSETKSDTSESPKKADKTESTTKTEPVKKEPAKSAGT